MNCKKTAGILFCIFFYFLPVCIAAEGVNENSVQEDWLTVLRAQGVSENAGSYPVVGMEPGAAGTASARRQS